MNRRSIPIRLDYLCLLILLATAGLFAVSAPCYARQTQGGNRNKEASAGKKSGNKGGGWVVKAVVGGIGAAGVAKIVRRKKHANQTD